MIFDDREGRKLENFNSSDLEKYSDYYQSIELKCPDLYHLSIYKSDMIPCRYNFCSKNICTCLDGVPASVCSENNQHECESCNDEYILTTDNKCKKGCRNKYICEDGTAFQEWECDDHEENDHHMLEHNPEIEKIDDLWDSQQHRFCEYCDEGAYYDSFSRGCVKESHFEECHQCELMTDEMNDQTGSYTLTEKQRIEIMYLDFDHLGFKFTGFSSDVELQVQLGSNENFICIFKKQTQPNYCIIKSATSRYIEDLDKPINIILTFIDNGELIYMYEDIDFKEIYYTQPNIQDNYRPGNRTEYIKNTLGINSSQLIERYNDHSLNFTLEKASQDYKEYKNRIIKFTFHKLRCDNNCHNSSMDHLLHYMKYSLIENNEEKEIELTKVEPKTVSFIPQLLQSHIKGRRNEKSTLE